MTSLEAVDAALALPHVDVPVGALLREHIRPRAEVEAMHRARAEGALEVVRWRRRNLFMEIITGTSQPLLPYYEIRTYTEYKKK